MMDLTILSGILVMFIWGIADFVQTIPIRKIGTLKTMLFSSIFELMMVLPFTVYLLIQGYLKISQYDLVLFVIAGILDVIASYNFVKSFEIGEVAIVSPISAAYSLVTVILAFLILGESLTILKQLAVASIILGIIFTSTNIRKLRHIHTVKGVKEALSAMFFWGIFFLIIGDLSKRNDLLNMFVFSWITITGFITIFALSKIGLPKINILKRDNLFIIFIFLSLMYLGAWLVFNYGLSKGLVSLIAPVSSLYPAVTVIMAVIFYKEKLVLNQKLGIVAILLGLFMISL